MFDRNCSEHAAVPFLLTCLTLAFSCVLASAQEPGPNGTTLEGKPPKLRLSETTHDFGNVWQGQAASCAFALYNDGGSDLEILKQKTTCGCTIAKPVHGTIAAGEKTNLEVTFHVGAGPGRRSKKIALYTNDPKRPLVTLTVTANVVQAVELTCAELDFGELALGGTVTREVTLTRKKGAGPIDINDVLPHSKAISVKLIEKTKNGCRLAVTLRPAAPIDISETLTIVAADRSLPPIKLPLKAKVHTKFFVSPARIFFGILKPGEQVTRAVTVGAPADDAIKKLSLVSRDKDGLKAVVKPAGTGRFEVELTWTAAKEKPTLSYHLRLTAESGKGVIETVDVPCYALVGK